jgi:hypothetical protein
VVEDGEDGEYYADGEGVGAYCRGALVVYLVVLDERLGQLARLWYLDSVHRRGKDMEK